MAEIRAEEMTAQNVGNEHVKPKVRHSLPEGTNTINGKQTARKGHFFGNMPDLKEAAYHSVKNIIEPRSKDIIYDVASAILESFIYPDPMTRPSRSPYRYSGGYQRGTGPNRTAYNKAYVNSQPAQNQQPVRQPMTKNKQLGVDDLCFETKADAVHVREKLEEQIREYGAVSVDFLYAEIGEDAPSTAYCWGWRDLRSARVDQTPEGLYWLILPEVTRVK